MKNIRRILCVALVAMFLCATALPAFAATARTFYLGGKGVTNYQWYEIYIDNETDKVTDVKSSSKKIFTIYSVDDYVSVSKDFDWETGEEYDSEGRGHYIGLDIKLKKAGTANLTYKLNGETQKQPIKILKYTNPVKSFVLTGISSNNLKSKFAKTSHVSAKLKKNAKAGQLKISAAKGWKIVYAGLWDAKASKEYQFNSWENPVTSVSLHVPAMKKGREYRAYAQFLNSSTGGEIYVSYNLTKK